MDKSTTYKKKKIQNLICCQKEKLFNLIFAKKKLNL